MKPAVPNVLRAGLIFAVVLASGVAHPQSDKPPTKIEVKAIADAQDRTHSVPLRVLLKDVQNKQSPAQKDVQIKLEIKDPNGVSQSVEATIPAGRDSTEISWLPAGAGVFNVKAREIDNELLDGSGAFLVKPVSNMPANTDKAEKTEKPANVEKAEKPEKSVKSEKGKKPKSLKKPHSFFHGMATCQGPSASSPTGADHGSTPSGPGAQVHQGGKIKMSVSVRDIGILADGKDSATIDLFYVATDGSDAPRDIEVWFSWKGGNVAPRFVVIRKGEAHAQALWTADAPVAATVEIFSVKPNFEIDGDKAAQVRFIKPVAGLNFSGPTSMSIVDIQDLVVSLESTDGTLIPSDIARAVTLVPQTSTIEVDPKQAQMPAGAAEIRVKVTPKSLGKAVVVAMTAGYPRKFHTIQITWLPVLILALLGGAVGGWLRYHTSEGVLVNRILVGIAVGCLAVFGYISGILPTTTTFVLHNLFSVPVGALLGGWLGVLFFDKIPGLSVLSGGK